ncbi:hypothetical protein [Oryzobacter telluris]|jgi:hypothetical protein|uniref:hypothetical protein n=1 Tax=Oryzobacter telluris TaxID=3149179 RepID=UPI00370D1451
MAGWFQRRIVRADLRDTDIVSSTGAGVHRFGEYLEDGRGGRWFWLVASVTQLALFLALPLLLAWGIWERSDLDRGDPVRVGLVVIVAVVSWWCALVWQGSVRGMTRALSAPQREWDPGEDEDGEG